MISRARFIISAISILLITIAVITHTGFAEMRIRLPEGFGINVFASDLGAVRLMTLGPDGTLLATIIDKGRVVALPDRDSDGKADQVVIFAEGIRFPHGITLHNGHIYVAELQRVLRFKDADGDLTADEREVVVDGLPRPGDHFTRTIGFGPDGNLYISVGSTCNVCQEEDPRHAAILQYRPDGSGGRIYARGLRNAVGFVWRPETGEMWATDNGRDWLGDDLPPEEINVIKDGADYGWPYCYGDRKPNPEFRDSERCAGTVGPAVEMQAHSAPLGLAFYTGNQFPQEYRGDLFVAFHGSWNRTEPTGYKVIRVPMRGGKPGRPQDFATGWFVKGSLWGRPVDVIVGPDGSLLVSDDHGGRIYRITHKQ